MFDAPQVRYPVKRKRSDDTVEVPITALITMLAEQFRNAADSADEVRKLADGMDRIADAITEASKP